jgi:hypothetical protein
VIGLIDTTGLDQDSDEDGESLGALQIESARSDDFFSFSSIVDDVVHDMVPFVKHKIQDIVPNPNKIQDIVQTPEKIQDIVTFRNEIQDIVPRRAARMSSFSSDLDDIFEECGEIETKEMLVTPARKTSTLMERSSFQLDDDDYSPVDPVLGNLSRKFSKSTVKQFHKGKQAVAAKEKKVKHIVDDSDGRKKEAYDRKKRKCIASKEAVAAVLRGFGTKEDANAAGRAAYAKCP